MTGSVGQAVEQFVAVDVAVSRAEPALVTIADTEGLIGLLDLSVIEVLLNKLLFTAKDITSIEELAKRDVDTLET